MNAIVGYSSPAGEINKEDSGRKFGYDMQLGSGTLDPFFGTTYITQSNVLSFGTQYIFKLRKGYNAFNYRLGYDFDFNTWLAIKASHHFSFSAGLNYKSIGRIKGTDEEMGDEDYIINNSLNSGRTQLDASFGTNYYVPNGFLKRLRFALQIQFPIYQEVNGIQLQNPLTGTFGMAYSFGGGKKES